MKAKKTTAPKKKSWLQSVKDEGLISGTMDKMGITNPYAKIAGEFTPLIPGTISQQHDVDIPKMLHYPWPKT